MSEVKVTSLDSNMNILEQITMLNPEEISLLVVDGRCFFQRETCVNLAPESGWKCARCGYDAEGFRGQVVYWNFCPKCGAINQEVL